MSTQFTAVEGERPFPITCNGRVRNRAAPGHPRRRRCWRVVCWMCTISICARRGADESRAQHCALVGQDDCPSFDPRFPVV